MLPKYELVNFPFGKTEVVHAEKTIELKALSVKKKSRKVPLIDDPLWRLFEDSKGL